MDEIKEIERSIIKKYRKEIWSKFVKGVKDFEMIKENDKIAVCISGGKDSFLLAKCMEEIKRHGKFDFDDLIGASIIGGRKGGMPEMILEYVLKQKGYEVSNSDVNAQIYIRTDVTFDVVEFPPKVPQPNVNDGTLVL